MITLDEVERNFGLYSARDYLLTARNGYIDAHTQAQARWAPLVEMGLVSASHDRMQSLGFAYPRFEITPLGEELLEDIQTFIALRRVP